MKFNNVTFPHPVLGVGDAVQGICNLLPEPEITVGSDSYLITVNCNHDNTELGKLVSENNAEYFCEATCSDTLFRQIYKSNTSIIEFNIPRKNIKGRVSFLCALVTKSNLKKYKNSESHPDYAEYVFDLETGDILAFFGQFSFDADINYEKLKAVSSFMEVVENKDTEVLFTNIDLSKNKIEIQLPAKDYQLFASDQISQKSEFAPLFHSSLVLNALLVALYEIDNYKQTSWARAISYRMESDNLLKTMSTEEKVRIPEIAQILLDFPYGRLMPSLQTIFDDKNNTDDD